MPMRMKKGKTIIELKEYKRAESHEELIKYGYKLYERTGSYEELTKYGCKPVRQ